MKSRSIFLLVLFFSLLLFSCEKDSDSPTLLTFSYTGIYEQYPKGGGRARQEIRKILLEQGLDIDYSLSRYPQRDYKNLLKQSLLTETAPMAFSVSVNHWIDLAQQDLLLPLESYLSKMPHYQALADPKDLDQYTLDGHIYALPKLYMDGPINGAYADGWAIRKDWLEKLNLSLPHNLEELELVLKAFTEGDPDGNGIDDTIGLSLDDNCSLLWGAYGLPFVNINLGWQKNSLGILQHMTTLPEAGKILQLLNRWYEAGYIELNLNQQSKIDLLTEGKTGIVITNVWILEAAREKNIQYGTQKHFQMMPPFRGPTGLFGYPVLKEANSALALSKSMTKIEVEKMISFLDWSVNTENDGGFMIVTYGVEGEHYVMSDNGDRILNVNYEQLYKEGFSNPIRFIPIIDRRWVISAEQRNDLIILNQEGSFLPYDIDNEIPIIKGSHFYTDFLWPKVSKGVIMGELDISAWKNYAQDFGALIKEELDK